MSLAEHVIQAFTTRFDAPPTLLLRAPGRVNLIGDHTDYNDGFVLPMAINRAVWIALRPRSDQRVLAHSLDRAEPLDFSLDNIGQPQSGWGEYVKGVAWALQQAGHSLRGWEGVVTGDVPIGAGLSSSAALEIAAARAFAAAADLPWQPKAMARIGQQAENEWVGMNCGIMDQMISAAGVADHALLIDCRSLQTQAALLPPGTAVLVLDTTTRRGLVDSAYNQRRAQCQAAAEFFGVPALRDVSLTQFKAQASGLDTLTRRRARHVISENQRTLQAAEAMRQGDATALGRLMDASHASLRDDFEVSSDALNAMVECAQRQPGCYGARMTGGGFGGCAVALAAADQSQLLLPEIAAGYQSATGLPPKIYVCTATAGAKIVPF